MKLDFIDITELKTSPVNVRKHGDTSGADLIPSIKANGVIQPLLVRPNCEGYEVIAGQRRFNACQSLAKEQSIDPIPCAIMEDGDDAKAIEASLAENIDRLPMNEIDQYEAFAALTKQGKTVEDIANHFGVTERLVRQRLAIAGLYAPILNAYRRDEIEPRSIRILTMASTRQQKAWYRLFKEGNAPQVWQLKSWLFGGEEISTVNALFDLATYKGTITSDLFGEDSYFADANLFWDYQSKAIAVLMAELEEDGWSEVILLDVGEHWSKWEHADVPMEKGGKVYIQPRSDGEVQIHTGLLPEKEAKRLAKAEAGEDTRKQERPELTKPMQNYLSLHRHAATRAELLRHQGVALRLAVAQIIAGSSLWTVHADPQACASEAIGKSVCANSGEAAMDTERATVRQLLGMEDNNNATLVYRKDDWGKSHDVYAVFVKLLSLTDEDVMTVLTFIVAETLPAGSALVELLGTYLNVDMNDHWAPDDTFLDLLRDKQAINAMLVEIGGQDVATGNITATAKVQKGIIRDCIHGENGRKTNPDWKPNYMCFPMQGYTKRQEAIPAVNAGKVIQKALKDVTA